MYRTTEIDEEMLQTLEKKAKQHIKNFKAKFRLLFSQSLLASSMDEVKKLDREHVAHFFVKLFDSTCASGKRIAPSLANCYEDDEVEESVETFSKFSAEMNELIRSTKDGAPLGQNLASPFDDEDEETSE